MSEISELMSEYRKAIAVAMRQRQRWADEDRLSRDPWVNGQHALAAIVWGLIALLVFGLSGGPA